MLPVFLAILAVAFALVEWKKVKNHDHTFVEVLLKYLIFFNVGLVGLLGFYAHAFIADETARNIGWPIGSPFQFEMAMANLSFGVLGVLSLRYHGLFWTATVIGYATLFLGCAYGHVVEVMKGNYHPWNAGLYIWLTDVVMPLIILGLLVINSKSKGHT